MKELIIFGTLVAGEIAVLIIGKRRTFSGNGILATVILLQILSPFALWAGFITWNVLDRPAPGVEPLTGEGINRFFMVAKVLGRAETFLLPLGSVICLGVLFNGLIRQKGIANHTPDGIRQPADGSPKPSM